MAGYIRQSTYTDGDVIDASDSNNEYDQLVAAFNNTSGHKHDGTAAEGPVIGLIGDPGVAAPKNKVVVDDTNNQVEVSIDVSGTSTEQFVVKDGVIEPTTDNDIDLGSNSKQFKDAYINGTANIDALVADTADINGGTIDGVTIGGASAGAVTTSSLVATTADINAGTVDGTVIGGASAAAITGTTIVANTSINIAGDGATVTGIKDEDDMASNSAVKLATQQSIKAYVDSQVTAQDLDFQADSGGALSIDLDSETFTLTGGTGIDTSGSGNAVTFAIDSTVTTLTGSQTLTNKTLTAPVLSGSSSAAGSILFKEDTDNGTNAVTLIGPAATGDVTVTLPAATDTLVGKATTDTLTNKTLTSAVLNSTISGTSIKDEDNMASNSADHLATQQSIKAYVDTQVATVPTGDITSVVAGAGMTGGGTSGDVTLNVIGGTGITANADDIAIDSTVTTLTGSQTLTNKTLTTPIVTTPVVNAGLQLKNGATSAGFAEFFEDSDNGTNKVTLIGPASTADVTVTLPAATDTLVGKATTDTLTNKTLTSPIITTGVLNGAVSGTSIKDEDNMASDSASHLATQQSIKAYVDATVTAQDLDFAGDSGGAQNVDLDSQSLTFTGGTGIDTTGSSQTMTVAIDSTVTTLTGTQTLTNKTLTSPTINGGSLSSAVTGATQSSGTSNTTIATTAFSITEANNAAVAMAIALG
tara:strand:+ start:2502 stop:4601 length:2100 start_codon:yes stop_codon:yes gene_type:complete